MDKIALCLAHLYQFHICTLHVATSHRHIAPILVHCPLAGRPRMYDGKQHTSEFMFALRSFSLVPECVAAAAADKRKEYLELVEVPGSVELLGSVVVQVPVAAADSEVVFRFFA